jgi:hypothetical protein
VIDAVEGLLQAQSPAAQAAIIGGIAGGVVGGVFTLLGGALGLFGERWMRTRGKVRCKMEPIELLVSSGSAEPVTMHSLPIPAELLQRDDAEHDPAWDDERAVQYFLSVKFFNEKEAKTGLHDVVIAFGASPHQEDDAGPQHMAFVAVFQLDGPSRSGGSAFAGVGHAVPHGRPITGRRSQADGVR